MQNTITLRRWARRVVVAAISAGAYLLASGTAASAGTSFN